MKKLLFILLLIAGSWLSIAGQSGAATYTVTNCADTTDPGTLRTAITDAVANPGGDEIAFNIPRTDANYVTVEGVSYWIIKVASALPVFEAPFGGETVIDGNTQTDNVGDDNPLGPEIMISAEAGSSFDGFDFPTSNTIKSLIINGFSGGGRYAINISSNANTIWGCYIGTTATASSAAANPNDGGIYINNGPNNYIGSIEAGNRNIISGNGANGVDINGGVSTGNYILGNYIGTDRLGEASVPNTGAGIQIMNSADSNYVGNGSAAGRNIISGNGGVGVNVFSATNNIIVGNYVGLNAAGDAAVGNNDVGVQFDNSSSGNYAGDGTAGGRNIISGNSGGGSDGVRIRGGSSGNYVLGNYIGTNPSGDTAIANNRHGIRINDNSSNNFIGDGTSGGRNIISGNTQHGIDIIDSGSSSNTIKGNYIGTDVNGTADLGNGQRGINMEGEANSNTIGGVNAGDRNIISGNVWQGIYTNTNSNTILNNYIGVNASGTGVVANDSHGIMIDTGATGNNVGNGAATGRNVVSSNGGSGIFLSGSTLNTIDDNYIGIGSDGTTKNKNSEWGISFLSGADSNTVESCVIVWNNSGGIALEDADQNKILANYIGIGGDGTTAMGHNGPGILMFGGANNNQVGNGAASGRNIISNNTTNGISIDDAGSDSNIINNNYIGTEADGTTMASNTDNAVNVNGSSGTEVKNSRIYADGVRGINLAGGAGTYEISSNVVVGTNAQNGLQVGDDGDAVNGGTISSNEVRAFERGASVYLAVGETLTFNHNTLAKNDNNVDLATGIIVNSGTVDIENCIITTAPTNTSVPDYSFGVLVDGTGGDPSIANVSYSDAYGNNENWFNNSGTLNLQTGTISATAKFTDADGDDFTLALNSPCIHTATPATSDMGAYQYDMSAGGVPAVRVISPNGSESWEANSAQTITWQASQDADGINAVNLSYSTNSGTSYTLIEAGLSNTGSYSWTVPILAATSATCRISVEAISGATVHGTDESDADFTIYRTDTTGPVITIESPATGNTWQGASTHNITFQATDSKGIKADSMNLYYSTDEGTSYPFTIETGVATTSPYSWILPTGLSTTEVKVKIEMQDDYNAYGTGESGTFIIDSTAPTAPALLTPTNNSNTNDATPLFTWSAATDPISGIASYEVRLSGTIVATTAALTYTSTTLTDASYTWDVRAKDNAGNYGAYSTAWTFVLDTSQIDPSQISLNIPTTDVPVDSDIEITFPVTMDTESVENAFGLDDGAGSSSIRAKAAVTGTFSWNSANTTMTFTPTNQLSGGTSYTLSISTAAKDQYGNPLSSAYSQSFTTKGGDANPPTITMKIKDTAIRSDDYISARPTFSITADKRHRDPQ
ncbi:hypothetical protein A2438_04415 [candidate division WOR-1 bacterium RIFOXYC2_FULL_46_14]|uniref:SbsA Ig-like domain-containing protein n=1 Tax=candidate division WOR-1 bacterium RIFOXYC2_FULL_46_14 TaxID=1802587 RepID=A0A1F4U462_UNCSA|nr:MAG: hypothetical protein A2438_04415 [candidate division WOR-1 bacterium RIFOXYC2_FULL_46_14]